MFKKIFLVLFLIFVLSVLFYKSNNLDQRKKLTFWSIQLKPVYEVQMQGIIEDFEKLHPDYKIEWIDIPINEVQKRTLASILSDNPPDLVNLNPQFSLLLAQKDTLYTFDSEDLEQFNPKLLEKLKFEDKIYGIPFYATSAVTIYNREEYDKCFSNKPFIKSYDELFNLSDKLYSCANIAPFAGSLNENDTLSKILAKYDISYLETQKEKIKASEIFSDFNKMYKNNELPRDILTLSHREVIEKYMSNQALIIVAGANFIDMIKKSAPEIYKKTDISYQLTGQNQKYDISLMNFIIPKRSKNIPLALELAQLITNEDNQIEFAKLTNVLPANKYALKDDYFKNCSSDLYDKSRCISAKQLENIEEKNNSQRNQSTIEETINKTFEEILLDKNSTLNTIKEKIEKLSSSIKKLRQS